MLKAVGKLPEEEWLSRHETKQLFKVLNPKAEQGEFDTLFVGGCVRNAYIEKEVTDVDLCTKYLPNDVEEILAKAGIKSVPTGKEHGTITAVVNDYTYEITTLRKDVDTDGRHAQVEFTDVWEEDAKRRDFTMNTLLADINGNIYDPIGHGLEDLDVRHVIFVGDPETRIQEDYLRILRFFRFNAWYGTAFDDDALEACQKHAAAMDNLSKERVTTELIKLLAAPYVIETLTKMESVDVLPWLFVDDQLSAEYLGATSHPLSRLVVLSRFQEDNLGTIFKNLRLSKAQEKFANTLLEAYHDFVSVDEGTLKTVIYLHGKDIAREWLKLRLNQSEGLAKVIETWEVPIFPVTGDTLIELGVEAGPKLGEYLKKLECEWISNGFDDSEIDLTAISLREAETSK